MSLSAIKRYLSICAVVISYLLVLANHNWLPEHLDFLSPFLIVIVSHLILIISAFLLVRNRTFFFRSSFPALIALILAMSLTPQFEQHDPIHAVDRVGLASWHRNSEKNIVVDYLIQLAYNSTPNKKARLCTVDNSAKYFTRAIINILTLTNLNKHNHYGIVLGSNRSEQILRKKMEALSDEIHKPINIYYVVSCTDKGNRLYTALIARDYPLYRDVNLAKQELNYMKKINNIRYTPQLAYIPAKWAFEVMVN